MKKRITTIFLALLLTLTPFCGINTTYAADCNIYETQEYVQLEQKIRDDLQFYFEEVGEFTKDGGYKIKDLGKLKDRAESGDEYALKLYEMYVNKEDRSVKDVIVCAVNDQYQWVVDLMSGRVMDSLEGYIKDKDWDKAAELLAPIVAKAVGTTVSKVNAFFAAASIAVSIYNCRGEL